MTVTAKYQAKVLSQDIQDDPSQRQCLPVLDKLLEALKKQDHHSQYRWWGRWWKKNLKGVYIYGQVGVGKTFLLDLFYDAVDFPQKKRFHFHHFMQTIDAELRRLQGHKNPLKQIANELAASTRLLCFDEFMVEDVANAMILGELLPALLKKGIVLAATSNKLPEELYRDGLHRRRFMPAIAAIKSSCALISIGNQKDYRLGHRAEPNSYIFPLGEKAFTELERQFQAFAPSGSEGIKIHIQNREIACLQYAHRVVWFDFKVICNIPRSQLDYLEIAQRFDIVLVSDIPLLDEKNTVGAILLIHFIDVMYDAGVRIILSAEVPIEKLYLAGELSQEFKRTASRLQEMQSMDYLARHPRR